MLGFNAYLPPTRQQTATPAAQHEKRKGRKKMKLVAAFLLAVLGGNPSPSAEDINKILASVGAEAESDRTELLLSQLQDRDIAEVMAAGGQQLASVPAGAGAGVAVAVSSSGGAAAAAADTPEPKKEEKVEEKEESDEDMGFSLFD